MPGGEFPHVLAKSRTPRPNRYPKREMRLPLAMMTYFLLTSPAATNLPVFFVFASSLSFMRGLKNPAVAMYLQSASEPNERGERVRRTCLQQPRQKTLPRTCRWAVRGSARHGLFYKMHVSEPVNSFSIEQKFRSLCPGNTALCSWKAVCIASVANSSPCSEVHFVKFELLWQPGARRQRRICNREGSPRLMSSLPKWRGGKQVNRKATTSGCSRVHAQA